jgi:hypothetical protein
MTEAEIQTLRTNAENAGHPLSHYDAAVYLQAREIADREPDNEPAQRVIHAFSNYILSGEPITTLSEFLLACPKTDEEKAEFDKQRTAFLKATEHKKEETCATRNS